MLTVGSVQAQVYSPQWGRSFGNSAQHIAGVISVDDSGNVLFGMNFNDSTKLMIDGVNTSIISTGFNDVLVKTTPLGEVIWYDLYDETSILNEIANVGNSTITTGSFQTSWDIDPGAVITTVTTAGGQGGFCQKLDENGEMVWGKSFGGSAAMSLLDVAIDQYGDIYLTGYIYDVGSVDVDPGPGVVNVMADDNTLVLIKLNSTGDYLWHKAFNSSASTIMELRIKNDFIYVFGSYKGTFDFDPGPGFDIKTSGVNGDPYICKINLSGDLIWAKQIDQVGDDAAGVSGSRPREIAIDNFDNVYILGDIAASLDLDPGIGEVIIDVEACFFCKYLFLVKYDSDGEYLWHYELLETGLAGTYQPHNIDLNLVKDQVFFSFEMLFFVPLTVVDLDNGPNEFNHTTIDGDQSLIVHLNMDGDFIWSGSWEDQAMRDWYVSGDTICLIGDFYETQNVGTAESPIELTATPPVGGAGLQRDVYVTQFTYQFDGLSGTVFTLPTSTIDTCDGQAFAYAIGGFPPYEYEWVSQIDSDYLSELDSACSGIHTLLISDTAGDSLYFEYYIADSASYFDWSDPVSMDTVYFSHENCDLDYDLPIDSAVVTSFYYLYDDIISGGQYFLGEITYYQTGDTYVMSDTVLVDFEGTILFVLSVYCPTKTTLVPVKTVLLSCETDKFNSINEFESAGFVIYPNPTLQYLNVKWDSENLFEVVVYNLDGRVILVQNGVTNDCELSLPIMADGIYIVQVKSGSKVLQKRLVKH